ncbi:MAG: hypothetical protein HY532_07910 [Chloroflexi bacterium]|nr:hypothetical protein [Chloroflexota bacterium]
MLAILGRAKRKIYTVERMEGARDLLTALESQVLRLWAGLEDGRNWDDVEIAQKLEVTGEVVTHIKRAAIGKIYPQDPETEARMRDMYRGAIEAAGDKLSDMETRVLQLLHGLGDGRDWTMEEVAQELGSTPGHVADIYLRAMRKLFPSSRVRYGQHRGQSNM